MSYAEQTWANGPSGDTPVDAARLQHIEAGLLSLSNSVDSLTTAVTTLSTQINALAGDITTLQAEIDAGSVEAIILNNLDGTDTVTVIGTPVGLSFVDHGNGSSTVTTSGTLLVVSDNGDGTSNVISLNSGGGGGGGLTSGDTITVDQAKSGGTWPAFRPTDDTTLTVIYTGWTDPFAAGIAIAGDKWEITADLS